MRFVYILICSFVLFTSCEQANTPTDSSSQTTTDAPVAQIENTNGMDNFLMKPIEGSNTQMATHTDENGYVVESGPLLNGQKTGTWVQNHPSSSYPAKIISYVDGMYNGIYVEVNDRGQHELMAYYKDNKLHGHWAKMRFGKPEFSATYKNGELDGLYREYDFKNGKIQKEVPFKNGKEDGTMKFYDEKGNVTVEYVYENGVKISGGIVE